MQLSGQFAKWRSLASYVRRICNAKDSHSLTRPNTYAWETYSSLLTAILDKTTWENVFINAHYLTQQNYFQIKDLRKENPLPQFKVASYKCLGIRLSFEDPTTLLPGEGGGKNRSATKFRKNARQVCNFLNSFVQDCGLASSIDGQSPSNLVSTF